MENFMLFYAPEVTNEATNMQEGMDHKAQGQPQDLDSIIESLVIKNKFWQTPATIISSPLPIREL